MKTNFIGQINGDKFTSAEEFIEKLNKLGISDLLLEQKPQRVNSHNPFVNFIPNESYNKQFAKANNADLSYILKTFFPWYTADTQDNNELKNKEQFTQDLDKAQAEVFENFIKIKLKSSTPLDRENIEEWSENTLDEISKTLRDKKIEFQEIYSDGIQLELKELIELDIKQSKQLFINKTNKTDIAKKELCDKAKALSTAIACLEENGIEVPENATKILSKLAVDIQIHYFHLNKFCLIQDYYNQLLEILDKINVQ